MSQTVEEAKVLPEVLPKVRPDTPLCCLTQQDGKLYLNL